MGDILYSVSSSTAPNVYVADTPAVVQSAFIQMSSNIFFQARPNIFFAIFQTQFL